MCFSVNPHLSGAQVKAIIKNTATRTITEDRDNVSLKMTYHIVDADGAVRQALNTVGENYAVEEILVGTILGNVQGYDNEHQRVSIGKVDITAYKVSSSTDVSLPAYSASTSSDENGDYDLVLSDGKYYINFHKEGYIPPTICDVEIEHGYVKYLPDVTLLQDSGAEVSNIMSGTVRDAVTGNPIPGATVKLRPEWDNGTGDLAQMYVGFYEEPIENAPYGTVTAIMGEAVTKTDENGNYSVRMRGLLYR